MLVPSKLAPAVTDFRLNCGVWSHECGGLAPAVNRLDESPKVGVSTPPVFRSGGGGTPPPSGDAPGCYQHGCGRNRSRMHILYSVPVPEPIQMCTVPHPWSSATFKAEVPVPREGWRVCVPPILKEEGIILSLQLLKKNFFIYFCEFGRCKNNGQNPQTFQF